MKRVSKALAALVCASLLTAGLTGCGGEKSADTIKVGANLELTGGSATFGISSKNAIDLAFKELNDKGGINGKKLELCCGGYRAEPFFFGNCGIGNQ